MYNVTENDVVAYWNIYCNDSNKGKDVHQMFADELGIPRSEAKELCYKIGYTITTADINKHFIGV